MGANASERAHAEEVRPLLCLVGPTAVGKSALALALAEKLDAEIVSVDSALVYRRMDIGTAKPSAAEQARVRHWLIDIREPWETYSAADFVTDASAAIADIRARGRLPLLCGGTMLYLRALLHGLSPLPSADPALRAQLQQRLDQVGQAALHAELQDVDPLAASRIHRNDPQRTLRALEVYYATGQPISRLQQQRQASSQAACVVALVPARRAWLHQRIAERLQSMLAAGFLDEMAALMQLPQLHPELPSMRSVGYRQAWQHLGGACDRDRFFELALYATRQLAKRQLTWIRAESGAITLDPELTSVADLLDAIIAAHRQPR